MTNKIPPYLEKYLDEKFENLIKSIVELKSHVNDEIQLIRVAIEKLEKKTTQLTFAIIISFVLLLFHDVMKVSIFEVILKLFS